MNAREERFLVWRDHKGDQVNPDPVSLFSNYLFRLYCRSVDHARWAEQYSEDVIIITAG